MKIEDARWQALMKELVAKAARGNKDIVWGKALGPKPRYFIVGDEPVAKDYITQTPFSGGLNPILVRALDTLAMKFSATPEDCYTTYVVKTTLKGITENEVMEDWLPILQLEFYLSGCTEVVCIGKYSKTLAGHIPVRPKVLGAYKRPFLNRLAAAWELLCAR